MNEYVVSMTHMETKESHKIGVRAANANEAMDIARKIRNQKYGIGSPWFIHDPTRVKRED